LAYLDEVRLAPEDAETLATKIEESEFATGLVHRIRRATRQLRLGAPKVDAKGMGLDANTVAEYLDNVFAEDRVADFERVCLESDVHLSEVASCHQILTLVLGVRADVDPALRDRIYALGDSARRNGSEPDGQADAAASRAAPTGSNGDGAVRGPKSAASLDDAVNDDAPVPPAEVAAPRPAVKVEVPDYLRAARRSSWRSSLVTVVLALVLVTAAMMAVGNLDGHHPVLGPLVRAFRERFSTSVADGAASVSKPEADESGRDQAAPRDAATSDLPNERPGRREANPAADAGTPDEGPVKTPAMPERTAVDEPAKDVLAVPATDRPSPPTESPTSDARAPDRPDGEGPRNARAGVPSSGGASGDVPDGATPLPAAPAPSDPGAAPVPSAPSAEVGRYLGGERRHLLARYDAGARNWYRLLDREVLRHQDMLLVLPSYRPQLALTSGVQCMLVGPSYVEFQSLEGVDGPVLALESAHALLDTAGVAGSRIRIKVANRHGVLTFVTADATVAISVVKPFPTGQDPGEASGAPRCRVMATSGQLEWAEAGRPAVTFQGGQQLEWSSDTIPEPRELSDPPAWIQDAETREIDRRASRELEAMLDSQRPLGLSLIEQTGHRQIEVASLAANSLCALGEFEPALTALGSDRYVSYWRPILDALRLAMVSQPEAPSKIRAWFEKHRPEDAVFLYRLLLGFTNEQLAGGDDARLVGMLEHRSIDVRVLAFENLRRITDRTYLFRPDRDPASQRRPLQDWRNALGKGEIRNPAG